MEHYAFIGGIQAQGGDAIWEGAVIGSNIFFNEEIEIKTWVENIQRVHSLRKYEFIRRSDGKTLVKGEIDWVFVDVKSRRPLAIPQEVADVFG